jgi:hypothetical protein
MAAHGRWARARWGLLALLVSFHVSCASQQSTGQALQTAGVVAAALAVGMGPEREGTCKEVRGSLPGDTETVCYRPTEAKHARAAVAGVGLGLAILGAELQRTAFDDVTLSPVPVAGGAPLPKPEPAQAAPLPKPEPVQPASPASCRPRSVVFVPSEPESAEAEGFCEDPRPRARHEDARALRFSPAFSRR